MKRKNNKKSKHENDEYSILNENTIDNTGCKWDTFNKTGTTAQSYNINDIFKEEEPSNKKDIQETNEESLVENKENVFKIGLTDKNISIKRYFESVNNCTSSIGGNKSISIPESEHNINKNNSLTRIEEPVVNKKVQESVFRKQLDLEKCKDLLKKQETRDLTKNNSNNNNSMDVNAPQSNIDTFNQSIQRLSDINTVQFIGKRKIEEKDFESTICETKRRIDIAIEEVKTKVNLEAEESLRIIKEDNFTNENYQKKNNNLEKENRLLQLEIEALRSKIEFVSVKPQLNDINNLFDGGQKTIKILLDQINVLEKENKLTIDKLQIDKRKLEGEVVGLKRIINKLVDKLKTSKENHS